MTLFLFERARVRLLPCGPLPFWERDGTEHTGDPGDLGSGPALPLPPILIDHTVNIEQTYWTVPFIWHCARRPGPVGEGKSQKRDILDPEMSHRLLRPKESAAELRHEHKLLQSKVENFKYHKKCTVKFHLAFYGYAGGVDVRGTCAAGEMNSRPKKITELTWITLFFTTLQTSGAWFL